MLRTGIMYVMLVCGVVYGSTKLTLSEVNFINISAKGNTDALCDEQAESGDPLAGTGGAPSTGFTNGYIQKDLYYPLEVVIDLGGTYALDAFCYFDSNGSDSLYVSAGSPLSWKLLFKETTSKYNAWSNHTVTDTTQYLYVKFKSPETQIAEIVIYGTLLAPVSGVKDTSELVPQRPRMNDFMGVNGFVDDPVDITRACGFVREYHSWQWDEGNGSTSYQPFPNNQYGWNPSWVRGSGWQWNFDTYYASLNNNGIGVSPCLQRNVPHFVNFINDSLENKPVITADPLLPKSYAAHADWMFQFTARYGSSSVNTSLIKVDITNEKKSGMALVDWIEDWNEPDKWWKGRNAYFKPFELAAMMSADYDGDQGRMGLTFGAKNADSSMHVAMPGLTGPDLHYIKAVKFWADFYRNGSFPADAINVHHYSNDAGGQGGTAKTGIAPELDSLRERAEALVTYRNRHLHGREVWFSEFGYDTHQSSPNHAPKIGSLDTATVQAIWIVRSYLALAAAGVDKAMVFMIRDDWGESPTVFASSGLAGSKSGDATGGAFHKKKSWYYVYSMRKLMGNYRFARDISDKTQNVFIYEFEHVTDATSKIAVVWSPTSSDRRLDNYPIPVTGTDRVIYRFNESDTMCTLSTVADGAALNVAVSEVPLFVKYTGTTSVKNETHSVLKNGFRGPGVIHVVNGMMSNGINVSHSENQLYTLTGKSVDGALIRNQVTRRSGVSIPDGVYIYIEGGRK